MKLRYPAFLLAFAALIPLSTQAQLLTEWEIIKGIDYVQTSAADPVVKSGSSYFWESLFKVDGGDTVTGTPSTNATGGTAGTQIHTFDAGDGEWGVSLASTSLLDLEALVNDGNFTTAINFGTAGLLNGTLSLSSDGSNTFFTANPMVTSLTNAAWSGGKLYVTAGTTATIGFNGSSVAGFGSEDLMVVNIDENGEKRQNTTFDSFTIGSGGDFNLVAGTYELEIEYVNYTDAHSDDFNGSAGHAGFLSNVLVELVVVSAVPEPSSYALLGGLAIFGAALRRRRRA